MEKTYCQLSSEERDKIAILRAQGLSLEKIAQAIGRNKSTVPRELKRNKSPIYNVYLPHKADFRAKERKHKAGKRKRLKHPMIRRYVLQKLQLGWSPEQSAGRLPLDCPGLSISHEAIYQYIYDRQTRSEIDLTRYLPRSHKKRRLFGHCHRHTKSHIPDRVSIDNRPPDIEKRHQPGHWEADTMISRQSKSALVVSLERSSRLLHINKITAKKSHQVAAAALTERLGRYPDTLRRSITYDNGSENADHQEINKALGTQSYFCNPYHSWEKGSVEHAISLIRRFLPKKTDFAIISPSKLKTIENLLNNRPRKCLTFKTPAEVFSSYVALAG
jgi:IS30 family transposase